MSTSRSPSRRCATPRAGSSPPARSPATSPSASRIRRAARESEERVPPAGRQHRPARLDRGRGRLRSFWYNQRWYEYTGTHARADAGLGLEEASITPTMVDGSTRAMAASASPAARSGRTPSRCAAPDGEYRWFLSRAVPIRDEQRRGRPLVRHQHRHHRAARRATADRAADDGGQPPLEEHAGGGPVAGAADRGAAAASSIDRLEARIAGLSANQDLLVERAWASVPVARWSTAQLAFLGDVGAAGARRRSRAARSRPPRPRRSPWRCTRWRPTRSSTARCRRQGQVAIDWSIDAGRRRAAVSDQLDESRRARGDAAASDLASARGSSPTCRAASCGGEVALDFAPEGFRWALRCPRCDGLNSADQPAASGVGEVGQLAPQPRIGRSAVVAHSKRR